MRCFRFAVLVPLLMLPFTLFAQESSAEQIIGRWIMEDAYTLHIDGPADLRLESHEAGQFQIDLIVYSDGTGVLGATGFSWRADGDAVVWDLGGRSVRTLPRVLDNETVLLVALVEGAIDDGAAVSVLRRQ